MVVYSPPNTGKPYELVIFNTDDQQNKPNNPRRLRIPPRYSGNFLSTTIDPDMSFGTLNRVDPLVVDPTQAFFIVNPYLRINDPPMDVLILLRTQALIMHACSIRKDTYISWDELGKDAIVVGVPTQQPLLVQGLHVITERHTGTGGDLGGDYIRTFDFSRRGSSVHFGGSVGTPETAWYESGRDFLLEGEYIGTLLSLGNGMFYRLVSYLRRCRLTTY